MASAASTSSDRGFSLLEVTIAIGILTVVALGVAQLIAMSAMANHLAKAQTSNMAEAVEKMEQLRGLTWGYDTSALGLPLTDTTTDLSVDPPDHNGSGLLPSPSNALTANVPGYVDYLNASGQWVGNSDQPPDDASYIRRWSVEGLPDDPLNTLVLQVLVRTMDEEQAARQSGRAHAPGEARLVSLKTRKAQP
ncbi:MAG: prepilin-type N-terminal cleavage/methylation domain-containing protein [Vicinamibacterales bacterium]